MDRAGRLSMISRRFVAVRIMHGLAVEGRPVGSRSFTARGHPPPISMAKIKGMIHVSIETFRAVIPGSRADEHSA